MQVDRPLRVAYIVKRFPRYSETFIVNELLAHEAAGCEIDVFSLRPTIDTHFQDTLARLRAPVRYVPSVGIRSTEFWAACSDAYESCGSLDRLLRDTANADGHDVYQALVLGNWLCQGRFEHVHAHFASLPTTVARLAARLAGLSWTFTAHAKDIFHEEVSHDDLAQKCRDAAAVVTVSDFNESYLREQFGHCAQDVVRVYNGLDVERLPCSIDGPRTVDVLAVGRLVDKKGFDVLIDACARLHACGRAVTCDIIGEGEREPALRQRIATHGLGRFVRLLGPRPQRDVMAALRGARVFAAPCLVGPDGNRDGLPTTILEAMATGTACVATPVTGIPEAVKHGETGVLVPCGGADALGEAIARLLDEPDERRRLARSARSLIETRFDARVTARQLRRVFAAAVSGTSMEATA